MAFWMPIVTVRMIFGSDWGVLITVFVLTLLLPVFGCFVLEALTRKWHKDRLIPSVAMITGIWATTAFWTTLAHTLIPGEGFHAAGAWGYVGLMTAFFPLTTIMISTYDGSLFAVLLTTIVLLLFSTGQPSFHSLISRCPIFGRR